MKKQYIILAAIVIGVVGAIVALSNGGLLTNKSGLYLAGPVFSAQVIQQGDNLYSEVKSGNSKIAMTLKDAKLKKIDDSNYEVSKDTSLNYQIKKDNRQPGLKETIVLKNTNAPNEFTFDLKLTNIKEYLPDPTTREWHFYNKDGKEVFIIPAGFMVDAKGVRSEAVDIAIANNTVKVTADKAWLSDPNRVYPIEIDPSVIVSGGIVEGDTQFGGLQRKVVHVNAQGSSTEEGVSTPVKIDDAGDPGVMDGRGRHVVRNSSGTLYAFINDGGSCEVWSSSDGSSWSEEDSADNPACLTNGDVALAIDGTDILHLLYESSANNDLMYNTFNTSTGQFVTEETVSTSDPSFVDLAVDSSNVPHAAFISTNPFYDNRVGGSWGTDVDTGTVTVSISIAIDEDDLPLLAYLNSANLVAARGNQNDASSFTEHTVDSSANGTDGTRGATIGVDSSGNTWVAYADASGTNQITLATRADGSEVASWTTGWTASITNSNVGNEPAIAIDGTDVYIFYEDSADDEITYDMYNGSTWRGEQAITSATTSLDAIAKWSYYNNNDGNLQIDFLYSDGTDIRWNKLTLENNFSAVNHWYAFYNDGGDVYYKKSSDGTTWDSAVEVDTEATDTDNYNPSVYLHNDVIYAAWYDDSKDTIEVNSIDTAAGDALGTKCVSSDLGSLDTTTFTVSIAVTDDGTIYVAYSDTSSDTEVGVYKLVFSGCTFTDINSSGGTANIDTVYDAHSNSSGTTFDEGEAEWETDQSEFQRAAARFPLTSIPSGATITNVEFQGNIIEENVEAGEGVSFYPYNATGDDDPDLDDGATLYTRAATGSILANIDCSTLGTATVDLGTTADTIIQGNLTSPGFFSLGTDVWNVDIAEWCSFEALEDPDNDPITLNITYTLPDPGITAGDRPVLVAVGNNLHVIFQDGNLSHSVYDGSEWTTTNTTIASVTDNVYSVTTDGTNLWVLSVSGSTATNFYKYDGASWTAPTAPWTGQTNLTSASLSYDIGTKKLTAAAIMNTSEQAYWKSTVVSSISWTSATSFAFAPGDLGHISLPMTTELTNQIGAVLRQGSNFEFGEIPPATRIRGGVTVR